MQAGHLRRAPAPLAGDDFIHRGLIGHRPHQDRLHDAALADRPGQGFDLICFEVLAWVARIGAQELDRDLALPQLSLGRRLVVIADEGRQAASEPGTDRLLRHDAFPLLSTSVRQHGPHHHVPFPTVAQAHSNPKRPVRPARATRHKPALLIIEGAWAGLCRRRDLGSRGVRRRNRLGPIKDGKASWPSSRREGATRLRARLMRWAADT